MASIAPEFGYFCFHANPIVLPKYPAEVGYRTPKRGSQQQRHAHVRILRIEDANIRHGVYFAITRLHAFAELLE